MVPPPVTPSPRRFVIKKPQRAVQSHRLPTVGSAQQFNATPRFHFAPSQRSGISDGALFQEETPLAHQYFTPTQSKDVIEDTVDAADLNVHDSIESTEPSFAQNQFAEENDDDDDNEYVSTRRSSKRRRLSPSPILDSQDLDHVEQQKEIIHGKFLEGHEEFISSATPVLSSPVAEPIHRLPSSTTAPRFILPSTPAHVPSSTAATITQTATFVKPPRFRPPDDQEEQQRPSEPLPDAFSPQRRGQKFIAGGLASEVTGWVMNLANDAHVASSGRSKEDLWATDIIVDEVRGGSGVGMTLISGYRVHAGQSGYGGTVNASSRVKIILAGSGIADGFQKPARVDVRKEIRIKNPVWEVVIKGEKWGVAVTWEVLS